MAMPLNSIIWFAYDCKYSNLRCWIKFLLLLFLNVFLVLLSSSLHYTKAGEFSSGDNAFNWGSTIALGIGKVRCQFLKLCKSPVLFVFMVRTPAVPYQSHITISLLTWVITTGKRGILMVVAESLNFLTGKLNTKFPTPPCGVVFSL